jgi:hypothetical protein
MLTEYRRFGVASPLLTRPENIMNPVISGLIRNPENRLAEGIKSVQAPRWLAITDRIAGFLAIRRKHPYHSKIFRKG